MSEKSPAPPTFLQTQGRWAWYALPLVALGSSLFLWQSNAVIREADWAARHHLLRNTPGWSLPHAFTGHTVGR